VGARPLPGAPPELAAGMNNRRTGRRGEEVALDYLLRKGFSLLERNYTALDGEIDLILKEGECLVFVEVKMRRGEEF